MDNKLIFKQMIESSKNVVDNSFSVMTVLCDHNEKMIETLFSQTPGLPEAGQKCMKDWITAYRTGCNYYKKMIDDNNGKLEAYLGK